MVRKELHLDKTIIATLEIEAKKQNRSLKNYLEFLVIQKAKKLELPSKEYVIMMDGILDQFENNEIEFSSIEDMMSKNGL